MINIILCGGSGTRLWPLSRTLMPKQFVKLFDGQSLFQLTIKRNSQLCNEQFIVSNSEQYFLALDQLEELNSLHNRYLLEPIGRNTAPAIALACMALDPNEVVLVTPSDHLIKDQIAYENAVNRAIVLAEKGFLVTFGIQPIFAEIGFGYIEANGEEVKAFHEKPDSITAEAYIKAGNYYWNSGMFCFKAGTFLEELEIYSPEIFLTCKKAYEHAKYDGMIRIHHEDMLVIPEDSIDYAVMEKSQKVKVIPSDIGWSDVGSFDALSNELSNDEANNFILSHKHVSLIDVQDLIVIDTEDALLISQKGSSQKVKEIVGCLKKENIELTKTHATVHRPWGTYSVLEDKPGYKIKKIIVKPGKRLSLQKHFHRNEHWIVVSGTATVSVEDKSYMVRENESTYIRAGEIHRLENQGKIPIVLIEAQVGSYTGEDDIVRIEDDFKRENI
ncbi:mannose-1-phosphate guanylyltransferase/mannose-6-phosphate isomerase [Sulfurospirillum deleyianum]|uniref:mannose-1-phosphate guanylyltransferase n=1 Tax=Sulfurospirillum deleyianum (strain ATCC 51133 / DSM 6946 / 5175) TaxID=525898 RepID=D1B3Y6_SULD5|nr:mannose-1-phosphate guanylyltransferase/mannose-6-phosphate isomerase [Sulfurospirillum deleyianum]ACZ12806.1 mannose-1-phosphate guanylyltransferase/mannose- 6-phosphate isomerase [Sulfurospirillum deleyianum DSM 6946]